MLWEILLIAACFVFILLLSYVLHHQSSKALFLHIEAIKNEIAPAERSFEHEIGDLKEDILDLVHDTISKMQPPSAFDHILGAIAHPLQAWMMRKAGIDPSTGGALVEQLTEVVEDL